MGHRLLVNKEQSMLMLSKQLNSQLFVQLEPFFESRSKAQNYTKEASLVSCLFFEMSIDSRVSSAQIQKAVKSLVAYAEKKKKATEDEGKTLFTDEDENVWLVITTKTMSPQLSLKPQRVSVLLFTKLLPIADPFHVYIQTPRPPHRRPTNQSYLSHNQRSTKNIQGPLSKKWNQLYLSRRGHLQIKGQVGSIRSKKAASRGLWTISSGRESYPSPTKTIGQSIFQEKEVRLSLLAC